MERKTTGFIFYHPSNTGSFNLMKLMENEEMLKMFELRSVQNMTDEQLLSFGIHAVPTIVFINGQNKGIYEKDKAFAFVNNMISNRRQNIMKRTENHRKLIQSDGLRNNIKDGIFEYNSNETQGISDAYAFWKDDMTQDIDVAQPKSFLPCGKDAQYNIMTLPENPNNKFKMNSDVQSRMVSTMKSNRDQQDDQIKQILEQQQIDKVLNYDGNI
jgi:hypothetical protein